MHEPLSVRVRRLAPYFKGGRTMLAVAALMMILSALSEAAIPWLLKPLLDTGFQDNTLPLWAVPTAIVLLAVVRGLSGWTSNYGLNHAAQSAVLAMRRAMFDHMLRAAPALSISAGHVQARFS